MTLRSAEEAAQVAERTTRNKVGMCQYQTRGYYLADSAGDRDHDKDADAVDGWLSEPEDARHRGDRNPPRGAKVYWSGGRNGHGHAAIALGRGKIRTTDAPKGVTSTQDLDYPEREWGLKYEGWTSTSTGEPIPGLGYGQVKDSVGPAKPKVRGKNVTAAITKLKKALANAKTVERKQAIEHAIKVVKAIPKQ